MAENLILNLNLAISIQHEVESNDRSSMWKSSCFQKINSDEQSDEFDAVLEWHYFYGLRP